MLPLFIEPGELGKRDLHKSVYYFYYSFFFFTLSVAGISPFLSNLSDDCFSNGLQRLMDKTEGKPEELGWSSDG